MFIGIKIFTYFLSIHLQSLKSVVTPLLFLMLLTCVFSLFSLDHSASCLSLLLIFSKSFFGFSVCCFLAGVLNQFIFNITIILVVFNFMTLLLAFYLSHQLLFLFFCVYLFKNFRLIEY